ncbi:MAG TPA: SOS response-associated peptidase [Dehalococcoidia bacterium]
MCGRFTLAYRERERLAEELGVNVEQIPAAEYRPRYNIAPTDAHWIVRLRYEDRQVLPARWGLVNSWAKDAKRAAAQINARAETLASAHAFRDAFVKRRCAVPADGFFEWVGPSTGSGRGAGASRQPIWFHRSDGGLILFAGLYESWQPQPGQWQRTFTIVTTEPNAVVSPIHDRMPVILPDDVVDLWLDPREEDVERLGSLLRPAAEDVLIATPVSPRVNSVKNDDAACLEPVDASGGQLDGGQARLL